MADMGSETVKRRVVGLSVAMIVLVSTAAPAEADAGWQLPPGEYRRVSAFIGTNNDPRPSRGQVSQAYFYAYQFGFWAVSTGGYIGIQTDFGGKRAVFSLWNSLGCYPSPEPGATCGSFNEDGTGYSVSIPYNWQAGHIYELIVRPHWTYQAPDGHWTMMWGEIKDQSTGATKVIGELKVPFWGLIDRGGVNWVEYYGPSITSCAQLPYFDVGFGAPEGVRQDGTWQSAALTGYSSRIAGSAAEALSCRSTAEITPGPGVRQRGPI